MSKPFIKNGCIACSTKQHGGDEFVLEIAAQQACSGSLSRSPITNDFFPSERSGIRAIGAWSKSCFIHIDQIILSLFQPILAPDKVLVSFRVVQTFYVSKCFFYALSQGASRPQKSRQY